MKINYEHEIKNISSLLEGKYKERQDILDNFENKNMSYFEILDKEIEDMEEELKRLKLNNNINNKDKLEIHDNNEKNIIHNLEISKNCNKFLEITTNEKIINNKNMDPLKKQCKNNIKKMVYESEKYINIIKQKIKLENNRSDFNNYYINLIIDLNRLLSKIKVFENNYEEIEEL